MASQPPQKVGPGAGRDARVLAGAAYATRFFMRESDVHRTLDKVTRLLDAEGIAYALVGALALNEHGYQRTTVAVDLLLTPRGLATFKERYLGRGYLEKFPGSRGLRDTETGVTIDIVLSGDYPGDGRPKPVAFPDVIELIRAAGLGRELALQLDPFVRAKFDELWQPPKHRTPTKPEGLHGASAALNAGWRTTQP